MLLVRMLAQALALLQARDSIEECCRMFLQLRDAQTGVLARDVAECNVMEMRRSMV